MAEDPEVPIHRIRVDLDAHDTAMCLEASDGVLDRGDALLGMDLLDDPFGIVPEELPGVETAERDAMEVGCELPTILLLPPGGTPGCLRDLRRARAASRCTS